MTSATLDGEKFSTYFDECPVLHIPGRCFPVSVAYAVEVPASYQEEVVNLALDIHCDHPPGDVLIFMTGQVRRDGPLHVARSLAVCVCVVDSVVPSVQALLRGKRAVGVEHRAARHGPLDAYLLYIERARLASSAACDSPVGWRREMTGRDRQGGA